MLVSIRKRFILSHAAMIITPILVIILTMFLVKIFLFGDTSWGYWQGDSSQNDETSVVFQKLIQTASLEPEKLMDNDYLSELDENNIFLIVRKNNQLIYSSVEIIDVEGNNLPAFGTQNFNPAGIWINNKRLTFKQHDFYFQDGVEGSVFLLNQGASSTKFARTFFPIVFFSLILTLVLTNILLSYFMSKTILKPIQQISDGAEKISNGDLNFTIEAQGRDELSKLMQNFESMRSQLKDSLELREKYENNRKELIANISHDLKTPITSIIGYVEGLEKGVANSAEKRFQYLETIHSKALYMNKLIEELALYSKLEVDRESFHFEEVSLQKFVDDYLEDIKDDIYEEGAILTGKEDNIPGKVLLDRNKFIRVLENIIYNGIKYGANEIELSLATEDDSIILSINDNGPGVSEQELSTIFTRFYRGDSARSTGGSGLGLAIAKQIIEAHGGRIWAEKSRLGGLAIHLILKKVADEIHE
jgi:histidine kinase